MRAGIAQVPAGPRHVHRAHRRRQPAHRRVHPRATPTVDADIDRWYETFPRLRERRDQNAGSLSGGEQQMLAIARALMSRPQAAAAATSRASAWRRSSSRSCSGSSPALTERRASPCCSSSRTPTWRWRSPTGCTCWRPAGSSASGTRPSDRRRRHHPQGLPGVLMDRFFEALFLGLSTGAIYALVALAPRRRLPRLRDTSTSPRARWARCRRSSVVVQRQGRAAAAGRAARHGLRLSHRGGDGGGDRPTAGQEIGARGVRRHDHVVPRHQRLHVGRVGRPPGRAAGQPVPQRPRRLRPPVRHDLAVQGHRHVGGDAGHHRAAVPAVPEDPLRAGDAWGGEQHRLGAAGRHPDGPHPGRIVGDRRGARCAGRPSSWPATRAR